MLCSAQLYSAPSKKARSSAPLHMAGIQSVKKDSAGSFLGNVASSIVGGVTNFFSKKVEEP